MPRLLRSWHSAIHNQAAGAPPATTSAGRPADGTGPFTFVESVSGSHLDVARWDGYRGPRTTWQSNHEGPAYLDGDPLDPDPRRPRARRGARARRDRLPPERLAARRRPARVQPRPRGDRVPAVGARLPGRSTTRAPAGRPRPARDLAGDRPAGARRPRAGRPRLAGPLADPVALAVVRARGRGVGRFDPHGAAQLLDAAGFEAGPDGVRLELETVVVNDATVRRVAETIREMLAGVGVRLDAHRHPERSRTSTPA